MADGTETINGYPIVKATRYVKRRGCFLTRAILVNKGDGEFVTALHCVWDNGQPQREWAWGHYFTDEEKALVDYAQRAGRLLGAAQVDASSP